MAVYNFENYADLDRNLVATHLFVPLDEKSSCHDFASVAADTAILANLYSHRLSNSTDQLQCRRFLLAWWIWCLLYNCKQCGHTRRILRSGHEPGQYHFHSWGYDHRQNLSSFWLDDCPYGKTRDISDRIQGLVYHNPRLLLKWFSYLVAYHRQRASHVDDIYHFNHIDLDSSVDLLLQLSDLWHSRNLWSFRARNSSPMWNLCHLHSGE
jgi:hypothetical protein